MGKERCLDIMKIGIHFGHWGSFYGQLGVRECLKQAKEAGVIDAAANLRELQKKRDDNALFDSFNMHN